MSSDSFGNGPLQTVFAIDSSAHKKGAVIFRWDPTSRLLATVGTNCIVNIYARDGERIYHFPLTGKKNEQCLDMRWDKDGETLAVLQVGNKLISMWSANNPETNPPPLDTNLKDPSFMRWSRVGPQLAVGSELGNLVVYNNNTRAKTVYVGRHPKKIVCGAWNIDNKLAMASIDRILTISDETGSLLEQTDFKKGNPVSLSFAQQKMDEKTQAKENTVCVNMGGKSLVLSNIHDDSLPVELQFLPKYGDIRMYHWFGDGYVMIGFSKGYVLAISTHNKEVREELHSVKVHESKLTDLVYCKALNKFASCGPDGVRVYDMSDWKEQKSLSRRFSTAEGKPVRMQWTPDGQILSVVTTTGACFNFLMSIPVVSDGAGSKMAYLSSLRTVHVFDSADNYAPQKLTVDMEPGFIGVGKKYVGVGMNTQVNFYDATSDSRTSVRTITYVSTVNKLKLNKDYAGALCDGKLHLQRILLDEDVGDRDYICFPPEEDNCEVTDFSLTEAFLVYSTTKGGIHYFYLNDWKSVSAWSHETEVKVIQPNPNGTRAVFIDAKSKAFVYSPVNDLVRPVKDFPLTATGVLWDASDPNIFIAIDAKAHNKLAVFCYAAQSTSGPQVNFLSKTDVPRGFQALMFNDGVVHGQKTSGAREAIVLRTHENIDKKSAYAVRSSSKRSTDSLRQSFFELIALCRLNQAANVATRLKSRDAWITLAKKSMELLNIKLAIRIYRQLEDSAMVLALEEIHHLEDVNLLAGHVCLLNKRYSQAQQLFLNSSQPRAALQMRRDLMNWEQSLLLAQSLAPKETPFICRQYAQQLEVKAKYTKALELYDRGLQELLQLSDEDAKSEAIVSHRRQCNGGVARMMLRLGRLQQGRQLALKVNDKHLLRECAAILNGLKHYNDAAEMYQLAEQYEKAAAIYIFTKNFRKVEPLMQHITTPKLHAQYAKAKEAEGDYKAAADAYEKAKDIDSVIRIMLNYLENPERAFQMVRETRSSNGAQLVATYCQKTGHIQSAIEFLLMAKRGEEAYKLAETKNHMDKYAMVLEESGLATLEEYLSIAVYFEEKQRWGEAGKYFASAQHFNKAVKYYLMAKDDRIMDAIDVIKQAEGTSQQEQLVRYVHQWIIGEGEDGAVKDKKYLFELCRAIGEYGEMEATSVLMAQQEQGMGQFAEAHNMLRDTYVELRGHKLKISNELKRNLRLLHSYLIAKSLGQAGDFETASRMLVRVAENISKFPTHIVKILTSTVVMCQKAGMKRSAYQYASMLMQPEYRNTVDKRVRPRIEALVRRPAKTEVEEKVTPCPICDFLLPETMLDCPQCKNDIPYCIATGKHMVLADWTACPSCEFPALYTPFVKHVAAQKQCPMCHVEVKLSEIEKLSKEEAKTALNNLDQEEEEEDSEGSPPDYDEEMDEEEYLATRNEGPRQMF